MICYYCGVTLNKKNKSVEHVIPNAIGGKKKAYNLLCQSCNMGFGQTIDYVLAKQLGRFGYLLNIALDRGEHKKFPTTDHTTFPFEMIPCGIDYYRAIAKIALTYYLSRGHQRQYCNKVKAFVKGESKEPIFHYYFPSNEVVHPLEEDEVSHVIHICGSKEIGALYAYVELFNMENIIIIFSMDYDGEEINDTYSRDVIKNIDLVKNIELRLARHHLEHLQNTGTEMRRKLIVRSERLLGIIESRQSKN